ncbi:unnamed protein product [Urochloa humidicola]
MPGDTVVIRLPGPRALRVLARSVLLAVALLFLPWLRAADAPARSHAAPPRPRRSSCSATCATRACSAPAPALSSSAPTAIATRPRRSRIWTAPCDPPRCGGC